MKNMFMLKRIALLTLVFFSVFLLIDFVPDSVSSESSSSGNNSTESNSTESCSPMEKLRNQTGAEDVELPEDFGEDVQPDPKPGATHTKRTVKVTGTDKRTVTTTPSSDGSGEDITTEKEGSGSVTFNYNDKTVTFQYGESETEGPDGSTEKEKKWSIAVGINF